jgi:hypothetical protein
MATTITIRDETFPGGQAGELTLELLTERVTVRELIRSRIYQEVTEYNASRARHVRGLVQPTEAERLLNGNPRRRRLDWEQQYERALQAFRKNGFLILVNDRQLEDLDEQIELRSDTRISFLRLVPLVGG